MNTPFKGPFTMRAVECKTGINRKVQSTFGSTYAVVDARGEEVSPELEASKAKWLMETLNAATK
jgi:hypothetical protein